LIMLDYNIDAVGCLFVRISPLFEPGQNNLFDTALILMQI
jgi:hypothetical protein